MVRSLAVGFGAVTVLAVAGSMTPAGQAMLGFRPPEKSTPVTVIEDKPVPVPSPVQPGAVGPAAAPGAGPTQPAAQGRQPAPQQGGPGGVAGVANILLNLPQILDQTHVGPSRGPDSWSESKPAKIHKKRHEDQDRKDDSD